MTRSTRSRLWLVAGALGLLCAGSLVGCKREREQRPTAQAASPELPVPLAAIRAERVAWRAAQDQRMRSPTSPLARVDYLHLPVGEHRVGPADTAARVAAERLAGFTGELRVSVTADPQPPVHRMAFSAAPAVPHNGQPSTGGPLKKGDTLAAGRALLLVTGLPADPSLAVYDAGRPRSYAGLHYFPEDDSYVVAARLQRASTPRKVRLAASRGEPQELEALGELHFTIRGTACSLEAYREAPGSDTLFLIFKDQTSGAAAGEGGGSYGAGRFLHARLLPDDTAVLDFNQAWNPLCAYSVYFHCPLPPRRNHLPVALPVGEMKYGEH